MEIPDEIRAVIDLFEKQLTKVSFPDVDAAVLRRHADELHAEAAKVEKARAALDAALAASDAKLGALRETARRATAYARIYCDAHPEREGLANAIAALSAPRTPHPIASARKRGRPRKHDVELFALPESDGATSLPT